MISMYMWLDPGLKGRIRREGYNYIKGILGTVEEIWIWSTFYKLLLY